MKSFTVANIPTRISSLSDKEFKRLNDLLELFRKKNTKRDIGKKSEKSEI